LIWPRRGEVGTVWAAAPLTRGATSPQVPALLCLTPTSIWTACSSRRSQRAVVMVIAIRAFPVGLAFTFGVRVRGRVRPFDLTAALFGDPDGEDGDGRKRDQLELGFVFADGRRVSSVGSPADHSDVVAADQVALTSSGGSSSRSSGDREYWLWPLRPLGADLGCSE
jgi:hypothetical protein